MVSRDRVSCLGYLDRWVGWMPTALGCRLGALDDFGRVRLGR